MRSQARHRPIPRRFGMGRWIGYGPLVRDGITGMRVPKQFCVRQRGVLVYRDYQYGTRDRPQDW
jgi:hypothetical protein